VFSYVCKKVFVTGAPNPSDHPEVWVRSNDTNILAFAIRGLPTARISDITTNGYTLDPAIVSLVFDEDNNYTADGPVTIGDMCTDIGRYGRPSFTFCTNKCDSGNPNSVTHMVRPQRVFLLFC
jgi:hypothetical protein